MPSMLRVIASLVTLSACQAASPEADAPTPIAPVTPAAPETPAVPPPPPAAASDTKAPPETPPAPPSLPPAPSFAAGRVEVVQDGIARDPGAMAERPRPPEDFTEHIKHASYSADGERVGYCAEQRGADCLVCTIVDRNGKRERISGGSECERSREALWDRLYKLGYEPLGRRPWLHGGDVVLVAAGSAREVKLGASLRAGGAEGFVRTVGACGRKAKSGCWPLAEVDIVVPSFDGQELAAVIHLNAGEHTDEYRLERISAASLAAAAYRAEGLHALVRQDFAAAADMFVRETHADPTSWKGPYNLACAYARERDPTAEPALREALRRDADAVRKRARDDADLAAVRTQPWFIALVGEPTGAN